MFSNKTSNLISTITCYADISERHRTLLINHSLDNRGNNVVSSHSSNYKGLSSKVTVISETFLDDVDVTEYDIIGVDEAQFFGDLVMTVEKWLKQGKQIVVSGLDSCSEGNIFGSIHELVHISDSFTKFNAYCTICKDELNKITLAPFTSKRYNTSSRITIGGSEIYYPTCRLHQNL
jgi:thymidine kinase